VSLCSGEGDQRYDWEEAIGYAHAVKIEALAQLGQMFRGMEKATGGQYGGKKIDGSRAEPSNATTRLVDLGIDKKTSMVAQHYSFQLKSQFISKG